MQDNWQRKPLLVRQALPDFTAPVSPQRLFEIASDDALGAESRLIRFHKSKWSLDHGPFEPDELPLKAKRDWTLLVQGMDLQDDSIRALLDQFRFIADARLDDLMISYAVDGGGVGPHLDSYDVFLLQAHGKRRWRYGHQRDCSLLDDVPLKLLRDFQPNQEAVLEPGDMLYLPAGWAHEGVAIGECMTYSIGFRAPSRHELIRAWLADCSQEVISGKDPRYADPEGSAGAGKHPGKIPDSMHQTLGDWLNDWRPDKASIDRFLGRFLTEPKASVWFEQPEHGITQRAFLSAANRKGLRADRRSRLAYRGSQVFINGEAFQMPRQTRALLQQFADDRLLPPGTLSDPSVAADLINLLHEWFDAGWIQFGDTRSRRNGR